MVRLSGKGKGKDMSYLQHPQLCDVLINVLQEQGVPNWYDVREIRKDEIFNLTKEQERELRKAAFIDEITREQGFQLGGLIK